MNATASPPALLRALFDAAAHAALPSACVPRHLPDRPKGRLVVVGAGKAAAAMVRAVEDHYGLDEAGLDGIEGVVVTRYGHKVATEKIEVLEASHPTPDEAGVAASERILETVRDLTADDLVLCLMSGGGSALLSLPAPGITLADKAQLTGQLLRSGATISEINCVRKHVSAVKGGRLARACAPARVLTLAISDVPGDDLSAIASGATVPDPTTFADARAVIEKYGFAPPDAIARHLQAGEDETPKAGDPCFERVENVLVATPQASLEAAARTAREAGFAPYILSDRIEGESRTVAGVMGAMARQVVEKAQPFTAPCVLLSGGETTVTIKGENGRGGPNGEFMLALALELDGLAGVHAIACDTDGVDGSEDNAGAIIGPATLKRAAEGGLDAKALLAQNDSYGFFDALGDLVVSGPTLTNVNDFRAILINNNAPPD